MNKILVFILIFLLTLASFIVYWFSIRPADIRKFCLDKAITDTYSYAQDNIIKNFDELEQQNYKDCLIDKRI